MTAVPKTAYWISPDEYLEGERLSQVRHEFLFGHVFAMAGASDDHNRIALNLATHLQNALRGKPCEAFVNDMKARVSPEVFYYPDVMVACDPADTARYYRERPSVVFEVISPETERTDRREKSMAYWGLPSVQSYVILEQDRIAATVLRRGQAGWQSESLEGPAAVLKLPELATEIRLERIYERTTAARSA